MANEPAKTTGKAVEIRPYDRFLQYVKERAEVDSTFNTADELAADQVEAIFQVDDVDSLFKTMETQGLIGFKDLEDGQEVVLNAFRLVKSNNPEFSGRVGAFAIVDAVNAETGENLALNTSIERILAFLRMCELREWLPIEVVVKKKTTSSGNTMITLAKPRKKPIKGTTTE